MDFWASLEHELKYKKNLPDSVDIVKRLYECAQTINNTDQMMMDIRDRINSNCEG
jgi:putative GTP pyrophosphokinase